MLKPLSAHHRHLQALCRSRDYHIAAKVAATNLLSALLHENWPGAGKIFGRLDSAIALAFLTDYPTPQSADRLGEARMTMFCKRHGYSGRRRPDELLNRLRTAPVSCVGLDPKVLGQEGRTVFS